MVNCISRILFMLLLVGCKPVEIGVIEKNIKYSGQEGIKPSVSYSCKIQVNNSIVFKEVKFKNHTKELGFYFFELPNGLLINGDQELTKGAYSIQIGTALDKQLEKSNDTLIFVITNKNKKEIVIEKKVQFSKKTYMK